MAKRQKQQNDTMNTVAETVGRALGSIAGTMDSLQAQHPHPVDEAREALTAGQEKVAALASKAGAGAAAVVKKTKAAARTTKKVAARTRRKSNKVVARSTRRVRKVVKRAKKAVKRGRKTVKRAVARRRR